MRLVKIGLLFLLLAGTVEAGEMKLPPTITGLKYNGETLLTCDEHYQSCAGPMIEQSSCYQRMQAAMQLMDRWLEEAKQGNVTFQGGIYPNVKLHWDDVMRECVRQ